MPADSPEQSLIYTLLELGCTIPDAPKAFEAIQRAFDEAGTRRAAESIRRMVAMLDDTAAGMALRRVISGDSTPLREAAKAAGVSHVAVFKQEKLIRKKLGLTSPPLVEN